MVWSIKEDTQTENKIWVLPCRSPARDLEQAKFPHEILEFTHNLSNVSSHQNLQKRTYSITQMIIKVEKTVSYMLLGWCKTQKNQRSNCQYLLNTEKEKKFQKNNYFCFIDYAEAFDCVLHNKLWKILQQIGIPDYLTFLLRNLYAGREATVRTRHGTMDGFQIGKGVRQGCVYCHPAYLNYMQSTSEMLD